ncbi:hypothetical protein GNF79_18115 [Clostridium perfringens]|jgi:hypothetical protein|uniref:Uncharacterized protein n=2 Tax=Clostridium perfringens TaxID=1502 RepID=A0AAW9I956_CLOPF|nr:hypothetical protein [Clostridium perfringens]MDZ5000938.1 hypothetical protein [Clostridium perfringens]MDZ7543104.1 hypothetical protein [Clostridium perfringens]
MLEKLILSDEDYDYLAKGIALGAGVGILMGFFIDNIILTFSACSVVGIICSLGYSFYKKSKHRIS